MIDTYIIYYVYYVNLRHIHIMNYKQYTFYTIATGVQNTKYSNNNRFDTYNTIIINSCYLFLLLRQYYSGGTVRV